MDPPSTFVSDVQHIVGDEPVDGLITMGTGQELIAAMLVVACKPKRLAIIPTLGMEGFTDRLRTLRSTAAPLPLSIGGMVPNQMGNGKEGSAITAADETLRVALRPTPASPALRYIDKLS